MIVAARGVPFLLAVLLTLPVQAQQPRYELRPSDSDDPSDPSDGHWTPLESPVGVPWSRQASGTAWLPSSTPMFGWVGDVHDWNFYANALVFAGVDVQGGPRGGVAGFSTNWFLFVSRTRILGGQFALRTMFSLEPYTVTPSGYPLLLQTGQSYRGVPLVDHQYANNLLTEIALTYQHAIVSDVGFELYLAPSGDPALGPPSFQQRFSAYGDPFAPIGHQWQDGTRISYGVLTAGLYGRQWKLEGSYFNARTTQDKRTFIEFNRLNSFSARLTIAPADWLVLQGSFGYLAGPEPTQTDTNLRRVTASAIFNHRLWNGNWATTLVWGRNITIGGLDTDAFLVETTVEDYGNVFFNRLEYVRKTGAQLNITGARSGEAFPLGSIVLGYIRDLGEWLHVVPGIGVRLELNVVGSALSDVYGSSTPIGGSIFVRLRPAVLQTDDGVAQ